MDPVTHTNAAQKRSIWRSRLLLPKLQADEKELLAALMDFDNTTRLSSVPLFPRKRLSIFLEAVSRHRLLGVLEYVVARNDRLREWLLGMSQLEHLNRTWKNNAAQTEQIYAELRILQETFHRAGIENYPLKGAFVGRACYPHRTMRPMSDLDILVHTNQITEAAQLLFETGYTLVPNQELHGPSSDIQYQQLIYPERNVIVELHHRLTAKGLTLAELKQHPVSPFLNRANSTDLAPHIHFAHKLLDIAKDGHLRFGLLHYLDLIRLKKTFGNNLKENTAWSVLERAGVARFAASTLWHLKRLCNEALLPAYAADAEPVTSPLLRLTNRWYGRNEAIWRLRYTPRYQRKLLKTVLRSLGEV